MSKVGTDILALDYNQIRAVVNEILGSGFGNSGYGQTLQSTDLFDGNQITAEQWQRLRNDIINIRLHQTGLQPTISSVVQGDLIRFREDSPNFEYLNILEIARLAKFDLAIGRRQLSTVASKSYTGPWSERAFTNLTVQFNNADQARYFFNSGGRIQFSSSRTGGSLTQQNASWSSLLSSIVNFSFGGRGTDFVNFYSLTNINQTLLEARPTATYANNAFIIRVRSNVADNSLGTATQIIFEIIWDDAYVDPGPPLPDDVVDGTISVTIDEIKASGPIVPSGNFNIVSPTYSFSDLIAF